MTIIATLGSKHRDSVTKLAFGEGIRWSRPNKIVLCRTDLQRRGKSAIFYTAGVDAGFVH